MSIMGLVWVPKFPLDTTHMRFQDPHKTLDMLRWPKMKNEGPIVLMMPARKKCPKPSVAWREATKTQPKITSIFDPQHYTSRASKGGGRRNGPSPHKHSLARRASALDHDGQAGLKSLRLSPLTQRRRLIGATRLIQARLPGISSFAVFGCCVGKSISATRRVAGTVKDQRCIMIADVSNP